MRAITMAVVLSVFSTSRGATPDYFPLKEGTQWTFTMSTGMQMTIWITGFADVGEVHCAIVETTLGSRKSREYLAVDAKGVKTYMGQAQDQEFRYDPPIVRIKLPFQEGDSWTAVVKQSGAAMMTTFQSIGKERVETPAGTFDCIKVYSIVNGLPGQSSMVSISYYADGIGPVRQVIRAGGQEIAATLTSISVNKPPQKTPTAPVAAPEPRTQTTPEPNRPATPATPAGANPPSLEKYQSPDGKVLLYKPQGWKVAQGDTFGPGTYGVTVMEPQENAVVLFITFPLSDQIKDSVALAANCITALRAKYPDLQATNINSTPARDRTIANLILTAEGEKGTGHGYFLQTKNSGSVYILLAKAKMWDALRPTLTTVAANLAYAPQGVAAVQQEGRQPAPQAAAAAGSMAPLAAMLKRAAQEPGKQVPLQPATLPDQSVSLQIPEGWTLEGGRAQYAVVNDAQKRTHGLGSLWLTIMPTQFSVPGVINAPYQAPPQALKLVLESGKSTRDVQVISECPVLQAVPELSQVIQQMQGQGFQVDARLIHVKLRNVPTGQSCRGLFCVMCSIKPISPVWQVSVQGSWAPESEYEQWLPLYLRVEKTVQVNQQWMGQELQNQAVRQQQLNRNLQKSIAESNRAFDDYMNTVRDGERSRDYTSHMWSQTTLGQGSWVAQSEGAKVYQTDSWGIEGPEGRLDSKAYNTANFTGENPWTGGQMELVNTRDEYEKYIANK